MVGVEWNCASRGVPGVQDADVMVVILTSFGGREVCG